MLHCLPCQIQDFPKMGMKTYYFGHFFPKSCMKLKKIEPREGSHTLLTNPLASVNDTELILKSIYIITRNHVEIYRFNLSQLPLAAADSEFPRWGFQPLNLGQN